MKLFVFLLCLGLISTMGYSQTLKSSQIPYMVKGKFMFTFPQTQDSVQFPVKWERDGVNYKASFQLYDANAYVILDSLGKTKKVVRRISTDNLPPKAMEGISQKYGTVAPKYVVKVIDENGKESYQVTMEITEFFTADGVTTTGKKEAIDSRMTTSKKK
ncbi:MAG: hypothetical protein WCK09_14680 [Bacteroidota bacterium]